MFQKIDKRMDGLKIVHTYVAVRNNISGYPSTNSRHVNRCKYTYFLYIIVNFSFVDSWIELDILQAIVNTDFKESCNK